MQEYDAPHWHWGPGYCEKHRGQGLPCKACIEAGDCTISGILVVTEEAVTEAVNNLPYGNPCAEIMLPSDDGIGGRLKTTQSGEIRPTIDGWESKPIARGMFEVYINGKLVGTGENLVVKATGKNAVMDVTFGKGIVPAYYGVPGPDGEITFLYNHPVKREDMRPGVPYQHHWGSSVDDDGRPGAFFKKEDIEKCLREEAWVLKPFEGFPNGPSNVDQVGVAGNPSPQGEVRHSTPSAVSAARRLCSEVERVTGHRPTAGELSWTAEADCLKWAIRLHKRYSLPYHDEGIKGWAAKLWELRVLYLNEQFAKAIQFGEDYGSSVDVLKQSGKITVDMARKLMRDFEAKYPSYAQWRARAKSVSFGDRGQLRLRVTERTGDGPIREVVNKEMGTRVHAQSEVFGKAYSDARVDALMGGLPGKCAMRFGDEIMVPVSVENPITNVPDAKDVLNQLLYGWAPKAGHAMDPSAPHDSWGDGKITEHPGEALIVDANGMPMKAKDAPLAGMFTMEQIGDSVYYVRDGWAYIKDEWNDGGLIKFRSVEEMRREREFYEEKLGIPHKQLGGMKMAQSDRTPTMQVRDETSMFKNPKHYEALRRINEQGESVQVEQPARQRDGRADPDMDSHSPDAP